MNNNNKKNWLIHTALIATGLGCISQAFASQIVVTGTRTEKFVEDSPVKTEIISAEFLEKMHSTNLEQALRSVPGLLLQDIHGKTGKEAWIQGISSDRVLILINGNRISASTGSTVDLTQVAVSDVLQIEIVKGGLSALYGSSAMGGVINIITKTPEIGWRGKLQATAGSYGDKNTADADTPASHQRGEFSYRNQDIFVSSYLDIRREDGFLIENNGSKLTGADGYKFNGAINTGIEISDQLHLELGFRRYKENHHKDVRIPGQSELSKDSEVVTSNSWHFNSDWSTEDYQLIFKGYFDDFADYTSQSNRQAEIETSGLELIHTLDTAEGVQMTHGIAYTRDQLKQLKNHVSELDSISPSTENFSQFGQYDFWLGENLEVLPGIRYQRDKGFGAYTAPKINVLYSQQTNTGEGKFRFGIGSGYRVPNIKERFFLFDHSNLGYMVLGNRDLLPERSYSTQLGYEFISDGNWQYSINLFNNIIHQLIETEFLRIEDGVTIHQYQNIDQARTRGIELTFGVQATADLNINAAYNYLESEDRKTGEVLPKRPRHAAKTTISYQLFNQAADLVILGQYQSKAKNDASQPWSPSWVTWDIKYSHQFFENFSLLTGVDNLFDRHRDPQIASYDLRPYPGQYIYAGFRWNL